ncbi:hypothetical protein [Faucicola boevrei]|uniref:hypothetical protein n=1 Tax=Faucicola boevrei TaxID=346665 RepID=UPI00036C2508|nr:hypothetical protein [Moraxella boevrei]
MDLNFEELHTLPMVNTNKYREEEFEITAKNYEPSHQYQCENDHYGATPALYVYASSYDPKCGVFEICGTVVYVCRICKKPVYQFDDVPF